MHHHQENCLFVVLKHYRVALERSLLVLEDSSDAWPHSTICSASKTAADLCCVHPETSVILEIGWSLCCDRLSLYPDVKCPLTVWHSTGCEISHLREARHFISLFTPICHWTPITVHHIPSHSISIRDPL